MSGESKTVWEKIKDVLSWVKTTAILIFGWFVLDAVKDIARKTREIRKLKSEIKEKEKELKKLEKEMKKSEDALKKQKEEKKKRDKEGQTFFED